jgi:hypothetical protein
MRTHRLDALFQIRVELGFRFCPSLWELVGVRVLLQTHYFFFVVVPGIEPGPPDL